MLVVSGDERDGDLVVFSSFDSSSKMSNKFYVRQTITFILQQFSQHILHGVPSRFLFCFLFLFRSIFATSDFNSPYTLRISLILSVRRRIRSELSSFFSNSSGKKDENIVC